MTSGQQAGARLTPEVANKLCDLIAAGNFIELAAAHVGIPRDTLHAWLRRGSKEESGKYREFSEAVERALATSEVNDVTRLSACPKDWKAIAWRLERRFPKRWGRRGARPLSDFGSNT